MEGRMVEQGSRHVVKPETREDLASAETLEEVGRIVRSAARSLAAAEGATFILADGDYCFYADEDAIAPLWKGQRFPKAECLSGWAMEHDEQAIVPNVYVDERIPLEAYLPTFVRSAVMTPVGSPPVAAIGVYWSVQHVAPSDRLRSLRELAGLTAAAVARIGLDNAPWAPNFRLAAER